MLIGAQGDVLDLLQRAVAVVLVLDVLAAALGHGVVEAGHLDLLDQAAGQVVLVLVEPAAQADAAQCAARMVQPLLRHLAVLVAHLWRRIGYPNSIGAGLTSCLESEGKT